MCQITCLLFLQRLKESISGDALDFNNIEKRAVKMFYFISRQVAEGIHTLLTETLLNMHHRMLPSKTG